MERPNNGFLRALTPAGFEAIRDRLEEVSLEVTTVIAYPGARMNWVYFPTDALISLLAVSSDGRTVETSMAGNEGSAGLFEALGSGTTVLEMNVQVGGAALRCPAAVIRSAFASEPSFQEVVWRLLEFQLAEARQSTLCVALHHAQARLARWLLESSDRTGDRKVLPLTQEFLAAMISVQRTTVTAIASEMQRAGLVEYRRGQVVLQDRPGLEALACECRAFTREQRERLRLTAVPVERMTAV